jgi:hypothetical protein
MGPLVKVTGGFMCRVKVVLSTLCPRAAKRIVLKVQQKLVMLYVNSLIVR